jgi:hypothetical protein
MPPEEIRAVLSADDPEIVRRFLELHRERLEEEVAEQRRTLAWLERSLTEEILERDRSDRDTLAEPAEATLRNVGR